MPPSRTSASTSFDSDYRLRTISQARRGSYVRDNLWRLEEIVLTRFEPDRTSVDRIAEMEWHSVLTPRILSVLLVPPEKMSLLTLFSYVQHLREQQPGVRPLRDRAVEQAHLPDRDPGHDDASRCRSRT